MTLIEYWKVIRHRWILLVVCALVGAALAWLVTPASGDITRKVGSYTATATVLVGTKSGGQGSQAAQFPQSVPLGRVALFITVGEVPVRAAGVLNESGNPALLARGLTVETLDESQAVTITAVASDGTRAAEVANAFADEAVRYFDEGNVGTGNTALVVVQRATPIPNETRAFLTIPASRPIRAGLAALLGLLIGFAIALVLDRLDSRLRTRQEVHDAVRMPVVAQVPRLKRNQRIVGKLPVVEEPLGEYANGYRSARTALMHIPGQKVPGEWTPQGAGDVTAASLSPARVVLVTSAFEAEGKTTSVANLAASFAETGKRVLVLDADLRSPDAHNQFDVPQGAGISDFLSGTAGDSIEPLLRPTSVRGVQVITAGTRLDHPAALASQMGPLIEQARNLADVVVIDTAPLLAASDVFDVLPLVDTVLLVVRSGRLTEPAGNRVAELLGRFQVPVTGAILLGAPARRSEGYGTGYGYGYGYGDDPRKKERKAARPKVIKQVTAGPARAAEDEQVSSESGSPRSGA